MDSLYPVVQLIHVLAASMWVGSHLILATGPLVRALRLRDSRPLLEFYRAIAWPATIGLLVAALTGLYMAYLRAPPSEWFSFGERFPANGISVSGVGPWCGITCFTHTSWAPVEP